MSFREQRESRRGSERFTGRGARVLAVAALLGALATSGEAAAQAEKVPGGPSGPIIQAPHVPKVGSFEFNFKLGPAIALTSFGGAFGAAEFNLGYAINRERTFLLTFSPSIYFIGFPIAVFVFPVGVQWDFPIPALSKNFYVYPSLSAGYALIVGSFGDSGSFTGSLGMIQPGAGVKYVHNGRINFGFEPVSIPILFNGAGALAFWRLNAYVGLVF